MAKVQNDWEVSVVDGQVRIDLGNGVTGDLLPGEANKFAGLLIRAAHEAVYNERPKTIPVTFNFEN